MSSPHMNIVLLQVEYCARLYRINYIQVAKLLLLEKEQMKKKIKTSNTTQSKLSKGITAIFNDLHCFVMLCFFLANKQTREKKRI